MSDGETIRAAFKGTLGKFSLDAGFTAPAKGVSQKPKSDRKQEIDRNARDSSALYAKVLSKSRC